MNESENNRSTDTAMTEPLFAGFEHAGMSGREVAAALRVSPATVSKLRRGHTRMSPEIQVFLTLMLAEQVERLTERDAEWARATPEGRFRARAGMEAARDALAAQEIRNRSLPGTALCAGARKFRIWWNADRIANEITLKPHPVAAHAAAWAL